MAAFINALAEEGTKDECIEQLVRIWDEKNRLKIALIETRCDLEKLLDQVDAHIANDDRRP